MDEHTYFLGLCSRYNIPLSHILTAPSMDDLRSLPDYIPSGSDRRLFVEFATTLRRDLSALNILPLHPRDLQRLGNLIATIRGYASDRRYANGCNRLLPLLEYLSSRPPSHSVAYGPGTPQLYGLGDIAACCPRIIAKFFRRSTTCVIASVHPQVHLPIRNRKRRRRPCS